MPTEHNRLAPRPNSLIIVYVQTRYDDGTKIPLDQSNIDQYVTLNDTSGDARNDTGFNVPNYESRVAPGGTVTWFGAVKNIDDAPRDFVIVNKIEVESGNGIRYSPGSPSEKRSFQQARIVGKQGDPDTTYKLWFNVWWVEPADPINHKYSTQQFWIDPKLKIHL